MLKAVFFPLAKIISTIEFRLLREDGPSCLRILFVSAKPYEL